MLKSSPLKTIMLPEMVHAVSFSEKNVNFCVVGHVKSDMAFFLSLYF